MGLACWATAAIADEPGVPAVNSQEKVVVTAKQLSQTSADQEVAKQVETALHSDRFFYDEHVTVSITNGVVRLEGIVHDYGDLRDAWRISKTVASVKRVDVELEVCCDFDNAP